MRLPTCSRHTKEQSSPDEELSDMPPLRGGASFLSRSFEERGPTTTMLPMQRLTAMRAGSRHVASAAPRLSRALKSGTWMDREMKYDT